VILAIRHVVRAAVDLVLYAVRSGRLWLPPLIVLLAVATVAMVAVKTVLPTAIYVLF